MQLRGKHIARNVLFNWLGTAVSMGVGFFLSPFILHRLGNVAYGVWVLSVSVVGYMALLDFGMQGSVVRFVSRGHASGDHAEASDAVSAALWIRLQISVVVLLLTGVLAGFFPHLFKIPASLATDARWAVALIGITTALTMSVGVFGNVLSGLNRYDLQNVATLVQTLVRVTGVVILLRLHYGIIAIAVCELVASLVSRGMQAIMARRLYPELRLRLKKPEKAVLRSLWSYSSYVFLTTVAVQLVYQTDTLVVGAFISAAAVTYYAIANALCRYVTQVIASMVATFTPAASTYEATGDSDGLLRLYYNGTRASIAIALPIMILLIVRGSTFIGLWMGPQYSHESGTVLIILCVGLFFSFANQTAGSIALGMSRHKAVALWAIAEGVSNLALSILLVHFFGLYGVAVGTLLPSLIVQLGFWPRYIPQLLAVRTSDVFLKVWAPLLLAGVPFALLSYALDRFYPVHTVAGFLIEVLLTLPLYVACLALLFRREAKAVYASRVRPRFAV